MKRNAVITAIAILLSVGLAGCRSAPLYDVKSAHLGNKGKSLQRISQNIKAAGRSLGWEMKDEAEGKIRGSIWLRGKHKAVVVITYNAETFNIRYADSINLRYNRTENTIHPNYNGWIRNLEGAIKLQVGN